MYFRAGISRVALRIVRLDYGKYSGLAQKSDEIDGRKGAEGFVLDALLEKKQLWGHIEDADDVREEVLNKTQSRVTAVCHDVSVFKKRYLQLVCALSGKVKKVQCKSNASTWQLLVGDE